MQTPQFRFRLIYLFAVLSLPVLASSVIGPATGSAGSPFGGFAVLDGQNGTSLTGSTATATYTASLVGLGSVSASFTCTFVANSCTANLPPGITFFGFNLLGSFTVQAPAGDTQGIWTIANNAGLGLGVLRLSSLTMNLAPSLSAFNPCMASGSPTVSTAACGALTLGAATALSISSATGGSTGIVGTPSYTNQLAGSAGDLYGQATLAFSGTNFITGRTYTFQADSDYVGAFVDPQIDTPEPSTILLSLAGFALIASRKLRHQG